MFKQRLKSIAFLSSILILSFASALFIFAWTPPTLPAPEGNVPAPINVGPQAQAKIGEISATKFNTPNHPDYYLNLSGLSVISGPLGIGTTNPDHKLEIQGGNFEIQNDNADSYIRFHDPGDRWYTMGIDKSDVTKFKIARAGDFETYVRLTIDDNGNVGIGTTNPGAKLEVTGQIKITGGSPGTGKILTSDASGLASWQTPASGLPTGTSGQTLRHDGTGWVANSIIYNNGTNVGIGTTVPAQKLEVSGNILQQNQNTLMAKNSAGTAEPWMWPRWSDNVMYTNFGSGGWNIRNNTSNNVMFMTSAGNVGIGTTGPDAKLHVIGSICAESSDTGCNPTSGYVRGTALCIGNDCRTSWPSGMITGSGTATRVAFWNGASSLSSNANLYWDNTNSRLGIGTTPTEKLQVAGGNIKISSSNAWVGFDTNNNYIPWDGTNAAIIQQAAASGRYISLQAKGGSPILAVRTDTSNVGIGTTAPAEKLDVTGAIRLTANLAQQYYATLKPQYNYAKSFLLTVNGGSANTVELISYGETSGTRFGALGASNAMVIAHSTGKVGIGTTNPAEKLHVAGKIAIGYDVNDTTPKKIYEDSNGDLIIDISN